MSTVHHHHHHHHRLTKRYNLYKILACSTIFFQLSLFCTTLFQLRTFVLFISSKTSSSQGVLGLPIRLLDVGFHLLIFCTLLSSAMRSTWPNQFNLCFLINPIILCAFNISLISWLVLILQKPSSVLVGPNIFLVILLSYCPSSGVFILCSQQLVFVILVVEPSIPTSPAESHHN